MSAIEGVDPYRLEWRAPAGARWVGVGSYESHDDARGDAERHVEKFGGDVRMVVQHVTEVFRR